MRLDGEMWVLAGADGAFDERHGRGRRVPAEEDGRGSWFVE